MPGPLTILMLFLPNVGQLGDSERLTKEKEILGFYISGHPLEPFRADGLHTAMYIVPILASILAVVLFAASRTVKKDVERLQTWMKEPAKT